MYFVKHFNKWFIRIAKSILSIIENKKKTHEFIALQNMMESYQEFDINNRPKHVHTIAFVIAGVGAYGGGITSILRLGTYFSNAGYNVYFIAYGSQSSSAMQKEAISNLSDCKGNFIEWKDRYSVSFDVVIATFWRTVYYMSDIPGYKMYFVQDYEPFFYNRGDNYLLAKHSYDVGCHMVSLGRWNKDMILKEGVGDYKIDCIDFPYEPKEYSYKKRDFKIYKSKRKIRFAVYITDNDRRLPFLTQQIMEKIKNGFSLKQIDAEIFYFGCDKKFPIKNGINLGRLNKSNLEKLYHAVDFGVVMSLTNISLVPFEMIATGLPIVELDEGSFKDFFLSECAILTDYTGSMVFEKIWDMIQHPEKLDRMQIEGVKSLSDFSWEKTSNQFLDIIKSLYVM